MRKMFGVDWCRDRWSQVQTSAAFWIWQRSLWKAHKKQAGRLYGTSRLDRDWLDWSRQLKQEAQARFAPPLERARAKCASREWELVHFERRLALFTRNLRAELDEAHSRLKALNQEIQEGFHEKEAPREALNDAKAYLDHWHSRADSALPIYGKKGKPIARHNLFGISTAKRDRATSAKRNAIAELKAIDRWLDPLLAERSELRARIGAIKADRASLKKMRDEGVTIEDARCDVADARVRLKAQQNACEAIAALRSRFESSSPLAKRIARLEQEITGRKAARKAFLAAFKEPSARAERERMFDAVRAPGPVQSSEK